MVHKSPIKTPLFLLGAFEVDIKVLKVKQHQRGILVFFVEDDFNVSKLYVKSHFFLIKYLSFQIN